MKNTWAWLMGLVFLASCGGGGDTSMASNGVGSGGTGSYTSGTVSGLGSIIVNGVRFDVTGAAVQDDEDGGTLAESKLKLGIQVEVKGTSVTAGAAGATDSAVAKSIRVINDIIGPISAVSTDTSGNLSALTVLGRMILVDSKTVYETGLQAGDYVEVAGLVGASGYTATRIDKLDSAPGRYKLGGVVSNWHPLLQYFDLGNQSIDYSALGDADVPKALRNGAVVRVRLLPIKNSAGRWVAIKMRVAAPLVQESQEARLSGVITELTDQQHFEVNGVSVDASLINPSGLAEGDRVEVKGKVSSSTLIATEVKEKQQADIDDKEVELHGRIQSATVSGGGVPLIKVRDIWVAYSPSVVINGPLALYACVEVRGKTYNATKALVATKVEVKDDCSP